MALGVAATIAIRRAKESDRIPIRDFHVANHLAETCHYAGERDHQIADLEDDFPQLYQKEIFSKGKLWIAVAIPHKNSQVKEDIVGSIGLLPDTTTVEEVGEEKNSSHSIWWLNTFSVAKEVRGNGVGSKLFKLALKEAVNSDDKIEVLRLVTLGNHSEGKSVMNVARKLYKRNGFQFIKKQTVKYGDTSKIDVMLYEKEMKS